MKKIKPVFGIDAPPPRPTSGALRLVLLWFGVPLVGFLFALDLLIWLLK